MNEADSGLAIPASAGTGGNAGETDLTLDGVLETAIGDAEKAAAAEGTQADDRAGDPGGDEPEPAAPKATHAHGDGEPSIHAPAHWPAERKAAFDALPTREAKSSILAMAKDLEAGVTRKSQELSEQAKFADAIRAEITEDDRQMLAAQGLDETGGIRQLLALNRYARKDPAGYVRHVMQALGVSADGLGLARTSQKPSEDTPERRDPDIHEPRQDQARLPELVDQHVRQALRQRAVAEATAVFDTFASETDDQGNLRHPHVDKVRDMMGVLAHQAQYAGLPSALESYRTLYDVAVRAHPDTREEVIAAEIEARAAGEAEARRKRDDVDKAKRALSPVKGRGTPPGPSHKADATLDDILDDVFSAHA
jgi:hypothetical protein